MNAPFLSEHKDDFIITSEFTRKSSVRISDWITARRIGMIIETLVDVLNATTKTENGLF